MKIELFGAEVYVSPLFFLVVSLMLFLDRSGLYMPALAAVLTHELGHLVCMKRVGCPVKRVRLVPAAVLIDSPPPASRGGELLVVCGGAAANIAAAGVLTALFALAGPVTALYYAAAQLAVGLYNLIPVRGLDGGRLVLILLSGRVDDPDRALRNISIAAALIILAAALTAALAGGGVNLSLLFFGIYIFILNIIKV